MKKTYSFLLFATYICIANIAIAKDFNQNQIEQIQKIIHEYIVNNPRVILEAGKKLQEQAALKEKNQIEKMKNNVPKYKKEIFDDKIPGRIISGKPQGKIIIAEFTQHQCSYCKAVTPAIDKLLAKNPEIKFITIYWPFFGNDAVYAAKVAIAAQKQNKFYEVNKALINAQEFMTKDKINNLVKTIPKLDINKLNTDVNAKEIDDNIKANFKLAEKIGLVGTPTLIFTNAEMTKFSIIPGQTPNIENDLNQALKEVQ